MNKTSHHNKHWIMKLTELSKTSYDWYVVSSSIYTKQGVSYGKRLFSIFKSHISFLNLLDRGGQSHRESSRCTVPKRMRSQIFVGRIFNSFEIRWQYTVELIVCEKPEVAIYSRLQQLNADRRSAQAH